MEALQKNTILFVRHGEALKGSLRTPEQQKNPPLSEKGKQQAIDLVQTITPVLEGHQNV